MIVSHRAQLHQPPDRVFVQRVLTGGVVQDGGGGWVWLGVEVQVGGARQGALRRAAGRLLRAHKVMVVVEVEVVVAVRVDGGVPQGQNVSAAGRQRRLGGGQVGAGAPQAGGLPWERGQDHRGGCCLENHLGALETLILITLRRRQIRP